MKIYKYKKYLFLIKNLLTKYSHIYLCLFNLILFSLFSVRDLELNQYDFLGHETKCYKSCEQKQFLIYEDEPLYKK